MAVVRHTGIPERTDEDRIELDEAGRSRSAEW